MTCGCRGGGTSSRGRGQQQGEGPGKSSDGDVVLSQFGHEVLVCQVVSRNYSHDLEDTTDDIKEKYFLVLLVKMYDILSILIGYILACISYVSIY